MFEELPSELTFSYNPQAKIFMRGQEIPSQIKAYGKMTLLFDRTDRLDVLSVYLRKIQLRCIPFSLPFDIDGDGQLEYLELGNVKLDTESFDLEASRGTLNLKTGDFELALQAVITLNRIPFPSEPSEQVSLSGLMGQEPLKFTIRERGRMNPKTGSYSLRSGFQTIKEGPLAGMQIVGGDTDGDPETPISTVELNVIIAPPGTRSCGNTKQDEVMICPGDTVLLCWEASSDVVSIDLDPGGHTGLATNSLRSETPSLPVGSHEVVYRVKTNGGHTPGTTDSAVVRFYDSTNPPEYQADPDELENAWIVDISEYSFSSRLEVDEIEILTGGGCLNWGWFHLEHYAPDGTLDYPGGNIRDGQLDIPPHLSFRIPGKWKFIPIDRPNPTGPPTQHPDPKDVEEPVCFKVTALCVPR